MKSKIRTLGVIASVLLLAWVWAVWSPKSNKAEVSANASTLNKHTCNSITGSHGEGRENGYNANFLDTGCGNWSCTSYSYGVTDIPYWINLGTFNAINIAYRNNLINGIRAMSKHWNEAQMHDGTGQIVNLYEVQSSTGGRPPSINGRRVCEVKVDSTVGLTWAGLFDPDTTTISISSRNYGDWDSSNLGTPLHEFGHLFGLDDLDRGLGSASCHLVTMGYIHYGNDIGKLQYQDIQGLAVATNRHTVHQFNRYVLRNGRYLHFCFFCDMVNDQSAPLPNSIHLVNASNCPHYYQPMVSVLDNHWLKCPDCYKVIERDKIYNTVDLGNGNIEIKSPNYTPKGKVFLPSLYNGKTVTSIGNNAFLNFGNYAGVTEYVFPNTLKQIGTLAFGLHSHLTSLTLPPNLEIIGGSAFIGWGITSVVLPNSVTDILGAFIDCTNLANVVLSNSLVNMGEASFRNTKISSIVLPNTLKTIGNSAFENCVLLTQLNVPVSVTSIGYGAFKGCSNLSNLTIPFVGQYANGTGSVNMGHMFGSTHYTIPIFETLTILGGAIADEALYNCRIKNLIIKSGVTSIGVDAFWGCSHMETVIIPSSVTYIGQGAFAYYDLVGIMTMYTSVASKPAGWVAGFNKDYGNISRPIIWGVVLSADGTYVNSVDKTASTIENPQNQPITEPYRKGFTFGGWKNGTTIYQSLSAVPNGTTVTAVWL